MDAAHDTSGDEAPNRDRDLPVLAAREPRVLESPAPVPVSPAVMAATGGFLAGVGALMLMRALRAAGGRRRGIVRLRPSRRARALEVSGSRSFLVDVHLLRR